MCPNSSEHTFALMQAGLYRVLSLYHFAMLEVVAHNCKTTPIISLLVAMK